MNFLSFNFLSFNFPLGEYFCVLLCKRAYDSVKIKNSSRKQGRKRDGIGVGRIRTFPFSSNSAYDYIAYNLVKTRLWESEAEAEG